MKLSRLFLILICSSHLPPCNFNPVNGAMGFTLTCRAVTLVGAVIVRVVSVFGTLEQIVFYRQARLPVSDPTAQMADAVSKDAVRANPVQPCTAAK